jgi:hypothetical protein
MFQQAQPYLPYGSADLANEYYRIKMRPRVEVTKLVTGADPWSSRSARREDVAKHFGLRRGPTSGRNATIFCSAEVGGYSKVAACP